MDSIFKISKLGEFGLLVEGLESDAGQYLSEDNVSVSHRAYRWDHSITINTLSLLNSEGTEDFQSYTVVDHLECCSDRQEIQLTKDGLYRISHIILPTRTWIDYATQIGETFTLYNAIYYYDSGKIYLWDGVEGTEVAFADFYRTAPSELNTIIRSDKNTFAMYYLNKCFSLLIKDMLKEVPKVGSDCQKCTSQDLSQKIKDRDLIWMFINVIKYSLETGQLYEAQRFLEKLNKCNSICGNNNIKTTYNNCGCY